jgi:predicted PurR-regulated permease PerM
LWNTLVAQIKSSLLRNRRLPLSLNQNKTWLLYYFYCIFIHFLQSFSFSWLVHHLRHIEDRRRDSSNPDHVSTIHSTAACLCCMYVLLLVFLYWFSATAAATLSISPRKVRQINDPISQILNQLHKIIFITQVNYLITIAVSYCFGVIYFSLCFCCYFWCFFYCFLVV